MLEVRFTAAGVLWSVMPLHIRPMSREDWAAVRRIYEEGMATGNATFQTEAPDWDVWDAGHLSSCRLVAWDGEVLGWSALSAISSRPAYAGVAEVSVYVAGPARGRGVGRALLERLIEDSEREGYWTLQAGIFPENIASVELHTRCGFRVVGIREKLGELNGEWRDVLLLERRSPKVYETTT